MQNVYATDIHFYESDHRPAIVGYEQINDVISNLQAQWPIEFQFEITRPASTNHQVQHVAWNLGVPGQPAAATGMDVAIIENRKIQSLHLFLDAPKP